MAEVGFKQSPLKLQPFSLHTAQPPWVNRAPKAESDPAERMRVIPSRGTGYCQAEDTATARKCQRNDKD